MGADTDEKRPSAAVATARCASYRLEEVRAAVRRCVEALPALQERFRAARSVLLKPNLLSSTRPPEQHVNTHPSVVQALAELLAGDYGCEVAVGDSCGTLTPGSTARALTNSRMDQVCRETGARLYNVDRQPRCAVAFERGRVCKEVPLPSNLSEFDLIVSVSKLKTHSLTGVTGPVKNLFGLLPGAAKKQAHLSAPRVAEFVELLCDVYELIGSVAALVDGIVGMEGRGPANGALRPVGLVAASADAVALDSFCARVMGFEPLEVPLLACCARRGLGAVAEEDIPVAGEPASAFAPPDYARPATYARELALRALPRWLSRGLFSAFTSRYAHVNQDRCRRCGECARNCPSKAISVDDATGRCTVVRRRCISCYCCAEVCPADAIDIRDTWPRRALRRLAHPFR